MWIKWWLHKYAFILHVLNFKDLIISVLDTDCVLGECVFTESVECPANMHYSECLMKCSKTCQKLNETNSCLELENCNEGCECNDGYLWDNDDGICITFQKCEQKTLEELNESMFFKSLFKS